MVLEERITTSDLDSDHFAARLIERIGWALVDAGDVERTRRSNEFTDRRGSQMHEHVRAVERQIRLWILQQERKQLEEQSAASGKSPAIAKKAAAKK